MAEDPTTGTQGLSAGKSRQSAAERQGKTKHDATQNAKRPSNKGAAAHRSSTQGRRRADKAPSLGPPPSKVDQRARLGKPTRLRWFALPASGGKFALDRVESCTWTDANSILSGTVTIREQPIGPVVVENRLDQGDRIRCEATDDTQGWREVWTMRVYKPQLTMSDAQRTFDLLNDLDLLRQSEDNFYYRRDHAHPKGWTGPEVIADVCRRYHVPLTCYSSNDIIGKVRVRRGSPLEVIRNVLIREHRKFRRRLVIRWADDRLYVLPLRRSPHLLELGPTLIEAAFQSELPPQFGSNVTIHGIQEFVFGQDAVGYPKKKRQKMHVELESSVSRQLYGFVHRIVFSPDARTDADLRKEGTAYLAAIAKPHKTLTLTHQGIPWLRRGDAIQLGLGDTGLRKQVVWVNEVVHTATPEGYTMDVGVIFDDPYIDQRGRKILFRLKATHDEAVGNRARLNPTWPFTKNNKADQAAFPTTTDPASVTTTDTPGPFPTTTTGG